MRRQIIEEMIKEIYGPRDGSEEIMKMDPWREYITGVIIPFRWTPEDENQDPDSEITKSDEVQNEDDYTEVEIAPNIPSELDPKMRPKSFGISFVVDTLDPSFEVCITWARYFENKIEVDEEKEENKVEYQRKPFLKVFKIRGEEEKILHEEEKGRIYLKIRRVRWKNDNLHIMVSIINDLEPGSDYKPRLSSCIFQPSIRINLKGETQMLDPSPHLDSEEELYFLYRKRPAKARGHMCSAIWKEIDYMDDQIMDKSIIWADGNFFENECSEFMKPDIRTEFIPLYPIPAPSFEWDEKYGDKPELSAFKLSELWEKEGLNRALLPLAEGYLSWIDNNIKIDDISSEITQNIIETQKTAQERIMKGIELLKDDDNARLAFCFANRTIYLQNHWKNPEKDFKWRPFQLAFILMNLESIFNEKSEDKNVLDLLWIPTGGGKTEAYMGIMAFTMVLRRIRALRGELNEKTGAGISIISRYTLRILTVQQFRRTLKMITAAEYLRVMRTEDGYIGWRPTKCNQKNNWIYGSARFSVGMWVGGAVSPNHLRKDGAIAALQGEKITGEPAQIVTCPVCDTILAIPEAGLPKGSDRIHVVAKGDLSHDTDKRVKEIVESLENIENLSISNENHDNGYLTLNIDLKSDQEYNIQEIKSIWREISKKLKVRECSLSLERPGYFGSIREEGRRVLQYSDFEIWCPNPECKLNNDVVWKEGVPKSENDDMFPDGLFRRKLLSPFKEYTRIPVPAYTVDEQVYSRCPTIVISTADKIARLSFEPRAASLFGVVDKYNLYYGFIRENLNPHHCTKKSLQQNVKVDRFLPPDLIVQDELHLIDGPLGSMFGLYETIVDGIIKKSGGNPKFIASTATIKNARSQVKLLFGKELFQFPPYGMDIDDSFFVKEIPFKEGWNKNQPGRVYMGVYSPGLGPMTPQIRIWSRALKIPFDNIESDELKFFWTLVGYYNSIRELGGGRALYREDIEERINDISDENIRNLDQERVVELSSRIDSTLVPLVLSELENDGNLGADQTNPFFDAVFTTSMFGTGVDISHLSFMIVNGQPKTTGSYIQATGRIGRTHGGLVISFLRAGRPRDLSHYEMFSSYHQRIHMGVEPVSVSPFSTGALYKAMGPISVAFFRNIPDGAVRWSYDDAKVILSDEADIDINYLHEIIKSRLNDMDEENIDEILNYYRSEIDKWKNCAINADDLYFMEYPWRKPQKDVVLGDPAHEHYEKKVVYKNAPQSLREIEETTGFGV